MSSKELLLVYKLCTCKLVMLVIHQYPQMLYSLFVPDLDYLNFLNGLEMSLPFVAPQSLLQVLIVCPLFLQLSEIWRNFLFQLSLLPVWFGKTDFFVCFQNIGRFYRVIVLFACPCGSTGHIPAFFSFRPHCSACCLWITKWIHYILAVTFSRLEPEGKLVMGGRKASANPSSNQVCASPILHTNLFVFVWKHTPYTTSF